VVAEREAACLGHKMLTPLDLRIGELHDLAASNAHEVIVVASLVELEHHLAGTEGRRAHQVRRSNRGRPTPLAAPFWRQRLDALMWVQFLGH